MRPTDKIKKYIKNIKVKTNPKVNQAVLEDLLDRMEAAQRVKKHTPQPNIWRTIMNNRITKLSAAAAVLIVGAIIVSQFVVTGVTFAKAVQSILNAKTLIYDFVIGPDESGPVMHDIVSGPRIRRTISNMPNITMILDTENARMLNLDEEKKEAVYVDMSGPLQTGTQDFLKFLRDTIRQLQENPDFSAAELGTQTIDGRKVIGFAAGGGHIELKIWADVKTALPVRIEMKMGPQFFILKNFEFDVPVDDSLVSMDVPPGYTLNETDIIFSDATEQDFIDGLRVWAEVLLDGHFPESITTDQYMKQVPLLEGAIGKLNLPDQEAELLGAQFIKGMMFINLYEAKRMEPWHYAGGGVKLGDAKTPIFWYRPKDSQTYRVIYGDLSVKDVAPEDLPK